MYCISYTSLAITPALLRYLTKPEQRRSLPSMAPRHTVYPIRKNRSPLQVAVFCI